MKNPQGKAKAKAFDRLVIDGAEVVIRKMREMRDGAPWEVQIQVRYLHPRQMESYAVIAPTLLKAALKLR